MDSRNISLPEQSSQPLNEASIRPLSINIDLNDLTCPVTLQLFFDPVLAAPCGHGVERSVGELLLLKGKCPHCRNEIVLFAEAFDKRRELDDVLARHPELYAQVYFNLDHFAEVVGKNGLTTPMGERFLKLLQHSANYLNDKADEGKQKNITAIEILASTYQGREIVRKDEKIRTLITPDSLQLPVAGKTIDE